MKKTFYSKNSITTKILIPTIIVMLIQACLFFATIFFGGTVEHLKTNAYNGLRDTVASRKNYIEGEMVRRWSNMDASIEFVLSEYQEHVFSKDMTPKDFNASKTEMTAFLNHMAPEMIRLLRRNGVNGTFIILNNEASNGVYATKTEAADASSVSCMGLGIRDLDQDSGYKENEDLLIERAPVAVTRNLDIPMDSFWENEYRMTRTPENDFYFKPIEAAKAYPDADYTDLGYWSSPFSLTNGDLPVLTYSVPLMLPDGTVFGVMGVEITEAHAKSLLTYGELDSDNMGIYTIAMEKDDGMNDMDGMTFTSQFSAGFAHRLMFGDAKDISFDKTPVAEDCYMVKSNTADNEKIIGSVQYFDIYNNNAAYGGDRFALIGLVRRSGLMAFTESVKNGLFLAAALSMLIGIICTILISRRITAPIVSISKRVRGFKPGIDKGLPKIGITEIDGLVDAIDILNQNVAESEEKLSTIMAMTDMPVGAFEIDFVSGSVFFSSGIFDILDTPVLEAEVSQLSTVEGFSKKLREIIPRILEKEENESTVFVKIIDSAGRFRWIRYNLVWSNSKYLGVISNVTAEIEEKHKIEYERDHDIMTNLLNRRAFKRITADLFLQKTTLNVAAMLMMDLDNLKHINDTYGHDYGDEYIKRAADVIRTMTDVDIVMSRMSGDEFLIFIYNRNSKAEVLEILEQFKRCISNTYLSVPNGQFIKMRISGGIAWYPDDSVVYDELVRFADFAMYQIKHTTKGEFREFSIADYNKDSYLVHNRGELNRLVENGLVEYYFQAIVDTKTGEPFGYEALMRSKSKVLKTPFEILNLARMEGRQYQIEKMTWNLAMEAFEKKNEHFDKDAKVFINSISNQALSADDIKTIEERYGKYLNRIVIELTEEERTSNDASNIKISTISKWGGGVAIDDFGSGYNGEVMLLEMNPDFVKLDMAFVRNVDNDKNRQGVIRNLMSYSKSRGIKIIAEGVETEGELRFLMGEGVDYIQGFLLDMPSPYPKKISEAKKELMARIRNELKNNITD